MQIQLDSYFKKPHRIFQETWIFFLYRRIQRLEEPTRKRRHDHGQLGNQKPDGTKIYFSTHRNIFVDMAGKSFFYKDFSPPYHLLILVITTIMIENLNFSILDIAF